MLEMTFASNFGRRAWSYFILTFLLCSCQQLPVRKPATALTDRQVAVLNSLRNEINSVYGFENGWPRINRGPCGRFAKLFHEQWNARFRDKIIIAFVMRTDHPDGVGCNHVLVRLPDGNYYDGGSGVVPAETLLRQFGPNNRIEDMVQFDFKLLDKRSYGLNRSYELCPNYSDETTTGIIQKYLALLPKD
jgi:hypothetical protein